MKNEYRIKELAQMYGVGTDTLRYYERLGLIRPRRGENGYRLYSLQDIYRLTIIRDLRQLDGGVSFLYGGALDKLLDFFAGRVRNYWQNRGEDSLLVDAALGAGVADVCQCGARLAALAQFSKEAGYAEAVQTFKRVANIVRKQGAAEQLAAAWQANLLQEDAEKALAATLDDLLPRLDSLWEAGDHTAALKTLLEVRPVVDAFFDGVMVMCEDAALRRNRLTMLRALGARFARLADFAALQV